MANSPFENNPAFEKLGEDAKKSVAQAFDAMSDWRQQVSDLTEKNSAAMFDKMAEASKAMGWPTEYIEMSRKQVQDTGKMQSQMVEQVMSAWEQQLTNPAPGFKMPSMPGMGQGGAGMPDFGGVPMMPMQLWMQAAEMWQKSFQDAMAGWTDAQSKMMGKGDKK